VKTKILGVILDAATHVISTNINYPNWHLTCQKKTLRGVFADFLRIFQDDVKKVSVILLFCGVEKNFEKKKKMPKIFSS